MKSPDAAAEAVGPKPKPPLVPRRPSAVNPATSVEHVDVDEEGRPAFNPPLRPRTAEGELRFVERPRTADREGRRLESGSVNFPSYLQLRQSNEKPGADNQ